jgi:hypothetical protein
VSGNRSRLTLALAALLIGGVASVRHAESQRDRADLILHTTGSLSGEIAPCG